MSEVYLSLFDYQGRPDIEKIGKKVYDYAKFKKIKIKSKTLDNGRTVMTYPKSFLVEYFLIRMIIQAPVTYFL